MPSPGRHLFLAVALAFPLLPLPLIKEAQAETEARAAAKESIPCLHPVAGERLGNYCLLRAIDGATVKLAAAAMLDARLKNEGYGAGLGIGLPYRAPRLSASFALSPSLTWSPNINGGNPDSPLQLGLLIFEGDPAFARKKGILAGLGLHLHGRYLYGKGRYLDYSLSGNYSHSPRHDIGVSQAAARLRATHHLRGWWYADAYLETSRVVADLANRTSRSAGIGVSKIFTAAGRAHHQAGLRLLRLFDDGRYEQNRILLSLDSRHPNGLFTGVGLLLGEPVKDDLATRYGVTAKAGIHLADKPLSLSAAWNKARGGKLLGFPRDETTWAITLAYPVFRDITLTAGYRQTDSEIDYFDISEPVFGVYFPPLRF